MSTWASRVSPRPSWLGRDCFQYVSWLEHVLSHFEVCKFQFLTSN